MPTLPPDYRPAFRLTELMTAALLRIERARTIIEGARILPAQEDELRRSARAQTIHYSNLVEGNELPRLAAEAALRGDLDPDTKAKLELVNYVAALAHLDACLARNAVRYTPEFCLELHSILMKGLGREGEMFRREHEGAWRDGIAVVHHPVAGITHAGPPPEEVPGRVEALMAYLESHRDDPRTPGAVLAGLAHYALTDIHPFADGNGRLARLVALAVLYREGLLARKLFSPERYYAEHRETYYQKLRSVRRNTGNHEEWLIYYLEGLAGEFERTAERVEELARLSERAEERLHLTPGQERVLAALSSGERSDLSRVEYERLSGVSKTTAARDLAALVDYGVLHRQGRGPASRYRLAGTETHVGRPREWSHERLQAELGEFLAGRATWPSVQEFRAAGRGDLYRALSRYGGAEHWRREVGLVRASRSGHADPERSGPRRPGS